MAQESAENQYDNCVTLCPMMQQTADRCREGQLQRSQHAPAQQPSHWKAMAASRTAPTPTMPFWLARFALGGDGTGDGEGDGGDGTGDGEGDGEGDGQE